MLEPDLPPLIFGAIAERNLEKVKALVQAEGVAALLGRYDDQTAIDHLFGLMDNSQSPQAFVEYIPIACYLLNAYWLACLEDRVPDRKRLDLQPLLGRAIHFALYHSHMDEVYLLVKALLKAGANVHNPLPGLHYNALGQAIIEGQRGLVHLFLEYGADPEAAYEGGRSYIALALNEGKRNILWDMLLFPRLNRLDTGLADTLAGGHPDKIHALLDQGMLIGDDLLSVIDAVVRVGSGRVVEILLRRYLEKVDNTQEARGEIYTALLPSLIRCEDPKVIEALVACALFNDGKVARLLDLAIEHGNDLLAAALVASDFEFQIYDFVDDFDTPLCPAFNKACLRGLRRTVLAFMGIKEFRLTVLIYGVKLLIRERKPELIHEMLDRVKINAETCEDLLTEAVYYDSPRCLLELIRGGCDPEVELSLGEISVETYSDYALSMACEKRQIFGEDAPSRFASALILLEAVSGPLDRLCDLCDFILIDSVENGDFEAVRFLAVAGISPEAVLMHFIRDYRDDDIADDVREVLCQSVIAACDGAVIYLDTLLSWPSQQLVLEGCMGFLRIDERPRLPLNIGLILVLCEIADHPDRYPPRIIEAVKAVIKGLKAIFRRISAPKSLLDQSSEIILTTGTEDMSIGITNHFAFFSEVFSEAVWLELLDRRGHPQRESHQLMALHLLLQFPDFAEYFR